jgi:hypothetical protein
MLANRGNYLEHMDTFPEIKIPRHISETFITNHCDYTFIYSFDYHRKSALGQCVYAHGKDNCYPVPVLIKFCANPTYFQDFEEAKKMIQEFLDVIPRTKPVIPFPKIGEGHSRLKEFSLKTYMWLHSQLDKIKYPNIRYV